MHFQAEAQKSFTSEDNYKTLLEGMTGGDYLLVGFGHNDEKAEDGRQTDPNGDYTAEGSFANSLYENYVKPAQEKGVTVIYAHRLSEEPQTVNGADQICTLQPILSAKERLMRAATTQKPSEN